MEFIKSEIKNVIIFVAILGGLFLSYKYFFSDDSAPTTVITADSALGDVAGDILPTLLQLHDIKIQQNQNIFKDPVFMSLVNYGRVLPPEDSGRQNPFAPTSGSAEVSGTKINVSTQLNR